MIVGAVPAAGSGTRMGRPKGTLVVGGRRLVDAATAALREGGCGAVVAVVRDGVDVPGASAVVNQDPDRGLRSSLDLAVSAALAIAPDAAAIAVLLADLPGAGADAVRAVVGAWQPGRVALARYADGSGHPIVMSPVMWRDALALSEPDEGARRYLAANVDLVDQVDAPGSALDLDTPDELAAWLEVRSATTRVRLTPGEGVTSRESE